MTCTWAASPRCMLRGLRAYQRVNTHVQGFAREQHTEIDTESAKVQTHSAKSAYFWLFSPNGSALWAPHHLAPRPHHHQTGGNCIIRGATHRRHAASQLLMVQNPLASRSAEVRKVQPHREDSTRSEGVESSRSGVGLAITRTFMNVEEACLPDCGTHGRKQHRRQPNFARNLTWSFFEMPQKRCNSNDANSIFEPLGAELRAKLLIDSHR